jgi:hypothetical protein
MQQRNFDGFSDDDTEAGEPGTVEIAVLSDEIC